MGKSRRYRHQVMSDNTVKLGLMPPLTGLVEIYGAEILNAGRIACQEINNSGGVLGRRLELVIEDDGSLPDSAVTAANKLIDEHKCTAIIGNLLSNSRISVAYQVSEPKKIPYLNFSFYEGSILSKYFFNFAALPNQQIDYMIPYMSDLYGSRMFFAGNNYEWPRGSIHAAKKALLLHGGKILGEEYCPIGVDIRIIDKLLDRIEELQPDVFVPYFAGTDQVNLLNRFSERGLKDSVAVVMGHYDEMMASQLKPAVRAGLYSSNSYFMSIDTKKNIEYKNQLVDLPGIDGIWPTGNGILTNFGEGTFICVKAFAQAVNDAGNLEVESIVSALEKVTVDAPQGSVTMNSRTHHAKINSFLSKCDENGVFNIVKDFGSINPLLPEHYSHQNVIGDVSLEEKLRLQSRILEQMSEAVVLFHIHAGDIVYNNAGANKLFGYDRNELLGENMVVLSGLDEDVINITDVFDIINTKGGWQGETCNRKKDGTQIWCAGTYTTFTHPYLGEVAMAVLRDITSQKIAQEKIKRIEQRFEKMAQVTPVGIFQTDEDGQCIFVNKKWQDIAGISSREATGGEWTKSLHPEDKERIFQKWRDSIENDRAFSSEYRFIRPDGVETWVFGQAQAEKNKFGKVLSYVGTITDISEIKKAEEELNLYKEQLEDLVKARTKELANTQEKLIRKERLATLGQLTATISHELRNPIAVMSTHLYLLKKYYDLGDANMKNSIDKIERNMKRCDNIIDELLDYSRIRPTKLQEVELDVWLKNILMEMFASNEKINFETGFSLLGKKVFIDAEMLRRAIINVIDNACQSFVSNGVKKEIRDGAKITIATKLVDEKIEIRITDNGNGMTKDVLEKIYEPLFSTKSFGVGLGMATVKQIVKQHKGQIEIDSTPNIGTTVTLRFPCILECV